MYCNLYCYYLSYMNTSNMSLDVSGYALKSTASVKLPVLLAFLLSKLSLIISPTLA